MGWRDRLGNTWQSIFVTRPWNGRMPASSATLSAQIWAEMTPWRMTAGWSMLAGMLATGMLQSWAALNWQTLILTWLLVDPLWGALWRLAGGRPHLLALKTDPEGDTLTARLPYLRAGSPASQLMRVDGDNSLAYLVRVALPTVLIALIVSGAIGIVALVATSFVILLTAGGWTVRRALRMPPLLLHATATVLMPWLLVWAQSFLAQSVLAQSVLAQSVPAQSLPDAATGWNVSLWLAFFWTLHFWGDGRASLWTNDRLALWLMGAAQAGILAILVIHQAAIWTPVIALLLMPTWLRVLRKQPANGVSGLAPWWLAALLTSALALGWQ